MSKHILIIGANGFIGSILSETILKQTDWTIHALDIHSHKIDHLIGHDRFHFLEADMTTHYDWIEEQLKYCDTFLPLAAIATPTTYVNDPLRIFNLDFEANLKLIRMAVEHGSRVIFPSTSEVYGMCTDAYFDEETSHFTLGPIHKQRWIYSCAKQMLDRVIYASGIHQDLNYTIFRPFNFYGPKLDELYKNGVRALTQFISNVFQGKNIQLVDGGEQRRCFCYIDDSIQALIKIIANDGGNATREIINIGNPYEHSEASIKELAETLINAFDHFPEHKHLAEKITLEVVSSENYYGKGYQDMSARRPSIEKAKKLLNWEPQVTLQEGVKRTLDFYLQQKH